MALYKTMELKEDNGKICGYFSTYEKTPDSYGDIIAPGAFTNTLEKRKESGHPFPLCFNHDFSAVIGSVKNVEDTEKGVYIEAEFLDTAQAQDVRKMLLSGAIYQFSFAYDVIKAHKPNDEEKAAGVTNVLDELEVFEISVVTVPANQNAVATEIKSAEPETKQGKRNAKADAETIKQCIELLTSLLDDSNEEIQEEEEEETPDEIAPDANAEAEELTDNEKSARATAILETIKSIKGVIS